MKRTLYLILCCMAAFSTQSFGRKTAPKDDLQIVAKPLHQPVRQLFGLQDVRVTDSAMHALMELDHQYLLDLDVDRLLSWFRKEAGVSQRGAEPYPYWESENIWGAGPLSGHILGFWLSSMAMMYETTGDEAIVPRVRAAVEGLRECQLADGEGFVGAQPGVKSVFAEVAKGNFTTSNPKVNGLWEPVYVMNKTLLGLYDVFRTFRLDLAKTVMVDLGRWFGEKVMDRLDHEQMQKLLVCEHGSINESFIDIYAVTGEKRFLEWAERLNDENMWVPAAEGRDVLQGWHANTQIPKFTGFESVYNYTDKDDYRRAARFFWQTVVTQHTWANGGNSTGEHFFPTSEFESRLTKAGGPESCNSVNMMRLTEALYQDDGDMKYVDYYERVLLNHILANYDPLEGMCVYYTSMRPASYKIYSSRFDSFWCCTGTGIQAPAKLGKMIYAHRADSLFVNMYTASSVNWQEQGLSLRTTTEFPKTNTVSIEVESLKRAKRLTVALRLPWWSKGIGVKVNGREIDTESQTTEGYVMLNRKWHRGDRIEVRLNPQLRAEVVKGGSQYYAFLYGPVLLGVRMADDALTMKDYRQARRTTQNRLAPIELAPEIVPDVDRVLASMERCDKDGVLRFRVPEGCASKEFFLEPYNGIHFSRYAVYL
ncbi:MAG: glycoside hydrolase family 127 protein, partial [Bacteroidaceae bacterium]|nr:glycoside hydrolase family 127 protein [Bacteroidaceae bacterium]